MCGIAGTVGIDNIYKVREMLKTIGHRGPDDVSCRFYERKKIGLGMTRLAIMDIENGAQPMTSQCGHYTIVFNGEIYNSIELRQYLERVGQRFASRNSDTEVLLASYMRWGEKCLEFINGMYAFVVYDMKENILFGARDESGIKPLYYTHKDGRFTFASELKCYKDDDEVISQIDERAVALYLSQGYIASPYTIYKGIKKIAPGSWFKYSINCSTIEIVKKREKYRGPICRTKKEALQLLKYKIKNAVERWLQSEVSYGVSLSGGIDSAALVGIISELTSEQVETWTLGVKGELDENAMANEVSRRWNTVHNDIYINPRDLANDLEKMVYHLDEPYAGGLPSWYIYKEMSKKHKVVITGTGGDELFGNYNKWKNHHPASIEYYTSYMSALIKHGPLNTLSCPNAAKMRCIMTSMDSKRWLNKEISQKRYFLEKYEERWQDLMGRDSRDKVTYLEMETQLAEEFLCVTDRFSMAWSMEARTPFLDKNLVETVLNLPANIRIDAKEYKGLLREAVKPWVPERLYSIKKKGFTLPLNIWARGELKDLIHDVLTPSSLGSIGVFGDKFYDEVIIPYLGGNEKHFNVVWSTVMLLMWARVFK